VRTEEQEDSYELHVARDSADQKHGHFVKYLFYALENADVDNFEILWPVLQTIIRKYNIRCTCHTSPWTGPIPAWVTKDGTAKPAERKEPETVRESLHESLDSAIEYLEGSGRLPKNFCNRTNIHDGNVFLTTTEGLIEREGPEKGCYIDFRILPSQGPTLGQLASGEKK